MSTSDSSLRLSSWVFCRKPPVATIDLNGTPYFAIDRQLLRTCKYKRFRQSQTLTSEIEVPCHSQTLEWNSKFYFSSSINMHHMHCIHIYQIQAIPSDTIPSATPISTLNMQKQIQLTKQWSTWRKKRNKLLNNNKKANY